MRCRGSVLVLCLLALPALLGAAAIPESADAKIDAWLLGRLRNAGRDSFLVRFDSTEGLRAKLAVVPAGPDSRKSVYDLLRTRARGGQERVRNFLQKLSIPYHPLYLVNAIRVEGDLDLARALATFPDVSRITGDPQVHGVSPPVASAVEATEWGLDAIHAPLVWSSDHVRGESIVVASADTGVEWFHPAIIAQYRGWDGQSASHDFNWHDSISDLDTPLDDYGHGTHTTGTMIGDDGAGNQIGVAPGARWIGCRNMDHGVGRPSTYLECMQYFLAPWPHGGNPELDGDPSKAPDIVNNSWTCPPSEGCDPLTLEDGFAVLEAAGILSVVSAGNSGSSCGSVQDSPAIYAETFSVGALDASGTLTSFSSRGPVAVDGSGRMKPDISAPGANVRSSFVGNSYAILNGTSMASPHVAGAAALLWSARPDLRRNIALTRCQLTHTAASASAPPQTCGGTNGTNVPNNLFGWGRVDAWTALHPVDDLDADGITDACDCAPLDAGAYATPGEIRDLSFDSDRTTLRWDSLTARGGPGAVHDVVRGSLSDLRSTGSVAGAGCLAAGISATSFGDAQVPGTCSGFYYLVETRNSCGTGGWGSSTTGVPHAPAGCP